MKQLAKPTNAYSCRAARYDGKQNTQYQSGAGQSSRGNRGNFGFRGAAGGGNGDWRSDNTQQSVGRGTYNPPDSAKRFYCHKKAISWTTVPQWRKIAGNRTHVFSVRNQAIIWRFTTSWRVYSSINKQKTRRSRWCAGNHRGLMLKWQKNKNISWRPSWILTGISQSILTKLGTHI